MRKLTLVYVAALIAVSFGGCAHSSVDEVKANWTARDRQLLANPPYAQAQIPEQYKRHTVNYPRKEAPGTIVVDTDNRYLYLVLPQDQAIRYGVTVGEEALAWSGLAKGRTNARVASLGANPGNQAAAWQYPRLRQSRAAKSNGRSGALPL